MNYNLYCAVSNLRQALWYHRHFGHPMDAFRPEHNARRREVNAQTVAAYAREAGRYLALARKPAFSLQARYPEACAVPVIRDALTEGHRAVAEMLSSAEAAA